MKKDYQKPMLISEEFIPNEYVAACYNFKALFHCHYGENNTNNHGQRYYLMVHRIMMYRQ